MATARRWWTRTPPRSAPTTGGPTVLSQYQYEPYGSVAVENHDGSITTANENTVGHQGLFFHKLAGAGLSLAPDSHGLYYDRNRWYSPSLGRFLTRDPNATGQLLIGAMANNGHVATSLGDAFSAEAQFGDGMNLYGYARNRPVTNRDPSGRYLLLDTQAAAAEAMYLRMKALAISGAAGFAGMLTGGIMQGMSLHDAALFAATEAVTFIAFGAFSEALFLSAEYTSFAATRVATRNISLVANETRAIVPAVGDLSPKILANFADGAVAPSVTTCETVFYRIWGKAAGRVGEWMSRTRYTSFAQAERELALDPAWRNSGAFVTEVVVPAGTPIYEGTAAGVGQLAGGGNQVFIPMEWLRDYMFRVTWPLP